MPIYEFSCAKCGRAFEELVLSGQPEAMSKVACPACGSHAVQKKISAFATSVKGSSSVAASADRCAPSGRG